MIKVSVIIPAYNIADYIRECVESVLQQTLKDTEIIIVNDGSRDNTLEIANEIAKEHFSNQIKVLNQPNQGLSAARNAGLAAASGDYVCFLDGDDWIDRDMLEDMYAAAVKNGSAVVICDYKKVYEDRIEIVSGGTFKGNILKGKKAILNAFLTGQIIISAANKMFKRSFLLDEDFKFPVGYLYEDLPTVMLISAAGVVVKVEKAYYNYRQRGGSIMHSISPKMIDKIILVKRVIDYVHAEVQHELEEAVQNFYLNTYVLQLANQMAIHGDGDIKQRDQYFRYILGREESRLYFRNFFSNKYINKRDKIGLFLFRLSPGLYASLYKKYKRA